MTNDCPVENVSDDNLVSIDFNWLNDDDVIPVATTSDSFNDELPSVANSSANTTRTVIRSSIELKSVSDVLLSSLSPQRFELPKPVSLLAKHQTFYSCGHNGHISFSKEGWVCKTCQEFC